MASLEVTLLDALWEWCTTLLGSALSSPDSQVIYTSEYEDNQDAPRAALPYILITPVSPEIRVGQDEYSETLSEGGGSGGEDVHVRTLRGGRYGTFTLTAYGDTAGGWLSDIALGWRWHLTARRAGQAKGIAVRRMSDVTKRRVALDNRFEHRWSADIEVAYDVVSSTTGNTPVAASMTPSIDLKGYPDDSNPVTISSTIPLE